jgi:HEAT repeat protein
LAADIKGDTAEQLAGLRALGRAAVTDADRPAVATALAHAAGSDSERVRAAAAKELGRWGRAEEAAALARLLEDKTDAVRQVASDALGTFPDRDAAAKAVRPLLASPNGPARTEASKAARKLDVPAADVKALAAVGAAQSGNVFERGDAFRVLAEGPGAECTYAAEVVAGLNAAAEKATDPFFPWNEYPLALGKWGGAEAVPTLMKLLDHANNRVHGPAMLALARTKDPKALKTLAARLDTSERRSAADALIEAGPAAEKPVLPLLKDVEPQTRAEACRVLKTVGTAACIPALKAAEKDGIIFVVTRWPRSTPG